MAVKTCRYFCKDYKPSFLLSPSSFIFFRFISLFKDFNKLFKLLALFAHFIFTSNATFLTLSATKYIKKDIYHIFKIVLKTQIFVLVHVIFLKNFQKYFFKACFLNIYCRKNYLNCYNFCQ